MSMSIYDSTDRQRQRLAWFILLTSFTACVLLTIALPVGANVYLQNAKEVLMVQVQANQGMVRIDQTSGVSAALQAGNPGQSIEPGATVVTNNTETAVVSIDNPRDTTERLVRLQIYSNTLIRFLEADTPRFRISQSDHRIDLRLEIGRIRLDVPETKRPLTLSVSTSQGRVEINNPGEYTIIVTSELTEVTVDAGQAAVSASVDDGIREVMMLEANQRAELPTGSGPIGRFGTDRNLISNGNFSQGQENWTFFTWRVDESDQPEGSSRIETISGEPRLRIIREGIGHADFRLRQTVGQDVTDLSVLNLQITFRINGQTLAVCGVVGSECPLFVRINYINEDGVPRVWQQGFFAVGEFAPDTPSACIQCAVVQHNHERVPLNQDFFYEVDFPAALAVQAAAPPRYIESIELVSSGHSFEVELIDVALLAVE